MSSELDEASSEFGSDHSDDSSLAVPSGLLSRIYSVASQYEEALASTVGLGGHILAGETLNPSEHAFVAKFSLLSMASKGWFGQGLTMEPSPLSQEADDDESSDDESSTQIRTGPSLRRSGTTQEQESYGLEPQEIVRLLVEQFGSLETDGDKENLILETEGALQVDDIVVIGVIHVTTHRLAFHATLLSSTQSADTPLKSGPMTICFRGPFKTKRRLWVELYHDVLCSYASSSYENKIRPLQSVLLSNITHVDPIDCKHPCHIRVTIEICALRKAVKMTMKVDTEEAALEWRREITGAIYIYRNARREVLKGEPDSSGIRLSIPLERITTYRFGDLPTLKAFATLEVELQSDFDYHRGNLNSTRDTRGVSPGDSKQELHMGPVTPDETWMLLGQYIASAKRRFSTTSMADRQVFIDFGTLGHGSDAHDRDLDHVEEASGSDLSSITSGATTATTPANSKQSLGSTQNSQNAQTRELILKKILAIDDSEHNLYIIKGSLYHQIASTGWFVLSQHHIFFYAHYYTRPDKRYRIPLSTVKGVSPIVRSRFCPSAHGLSIHVEAHADIKFQMRSESARDETVKKIQEALKNHKLELVEKSRESLVVSESGRLFPPISRNMAAIKTHILPLGFVLNFPKAINLPREILPTYEPLHFVCLTIGSRGDVQPYIALGLALMKEGHRVTIATHDEYADWIQSHGIAHRSAGGDPGALMKLSVENKMFSPQFFKESITFFRPWLDQLLLDAWAACHDADVLCESPSAFAGVHIAEALEIPYFRCFTMPWTMTSEFPHAFLSSPVESPAFNRTTYVLYENIIWAASSGQINRWRRKTLGISSTDPLHIASHKIPFLYNFSQAVVPKPLDWSDATVVTGYWFLDNPDPDWAAPEDLLAFIARARADGKPLVYVGFGSITVPHPNKITNRIIQAVLKSDVRAIISKGWSARMSDGSKDEPELEIPPECYQVEKVPHDWLFPQIDAALHHGGAGTTGASLRAGIPTLIKPWFGDQYFWASRVQKLGAGLRVPTLHVNDIATALTKATSNRIMKEMAAGVGERIRAEDGVHSAIHALYTYLPRASKPRSKTEKKKRMECIRTACEKYKD